MLRGSGLSYIEQEIEPSSGGETLNFSDIGDSTGSDTQMVDTPVDTPVDNSMPEGLLVSVHKSFFFFLLSYHFLIVPSYFCFGYFH